MQASLVDELSIMALFTPLMTSNIRTPISNTISSSDATVMNGGTTLTQVASPLAEALYKSSEEKGCYSKLAMGPLDYLDLDILPVFPLVEQVSDCATWTCSREWKFTQSRHVNVQGGKAALWELERRSNLSMCPYLKLPEA